MSYKYIGFQKFGFFFFGQI